MVGHNHIRTNGQSLRKSLFVEVKHHDNFGDFSCPLKQLLFGQILQSARAEQYGIAFRKGSDFTAKVNAAICRTMGIEK